MSTGAQEGIYVQHILQELNEKPTLCLLSDSSAARAVLVRRGVGRIKHLDVRLLWLQDALRDRVLSCQSVTTSQNLADLFTKSFATQRHVWLSGALGLRGPTPEPTDESMGQ